MIGGWYILYDLRLIFLDLLVLKYVGDVYWLCYWSIFRAVEGYRSFFNMIIYGFGLLDLDNFWFVLKIIQIIYVLETHVDWFHRLNIQLFMLLSLDNVVCVWPILNNWCSSLTWWHLVLCLLSLKVHFLSKCTLEIHSIGITHIGHFLLLLNLWVI